MANRDAIRVSWGDGQDYASVVYNDANLAIRSVDMHITDGRRIRAVIWDTNAGGDPTDPSTAIFNQVFTGPTDQSLNVAGNRRCVTVAGDGDPYVDLPPNMPYAIYSGAAV